MKFSLKANALPVLTLGFGGLALAMRIWLSHSRDALGLLPAAHPAAIISYVLTGLFLVVLFLCVRQLQPVSSYRFLFPASPIRAVGCGLGAVAILYSAIIAVISGGFWGIVTLLLGLISALALANVGLSRWSGVTPKGWLHMLPVVYLIVYVVSQVQSWSATPQAAAFFFPLMGCIFLMLAAFYHASLNVRKQGRRWFVFTSQAAAFFCLGAVCEADPVFFLCMAGWMVCDLCTCANPRKRETPREEQA